MSLAHLQTTMNTCRAQLLSHRIASYSGTSTNLAVVLSSNLQVSLELSLAQNLRDAISLASCLLNMYTQSLSHSANSSHVLRSFERWFANAVG